MVHILSLEELEIQYIIKAVGNSLFVLSFYQFSLYYSYYDEFTKRSYPFVFEVLISIL